MPAAPIPALLEILAVLLVALLAPARMLARVAHLDARALAGVRRMLEDRRRRGRALRYEGEDDGVVAARIDRMAWIARDPLKAVRHLSRLYRRVLPLRMAGQACPPGFAPPCVPIPALADGAAALIAAPEP